MSEEHPAWGHEVFDPYGNPIRLPARAVYALRRLGMLEKNRDLGGYQISEDIFEMMKSEYDPLTDGLRPILGADISGPTTVTCRCGPCRRVIDNQLHEAEQLGLFLRDMAIQQNAR